MKVREDLTQHFCSLRLAGCAGVLSNSGVLLPLFEKMTKANADCKMPLSTVCWVEAPSRRMRIDVEFLCN
jgi:hypothetical protein